MEIHPVFFTTLKCSFLVALCSINAHGSGNFDYQYLGVQFEQSALRNDRRNDCRGAVTNGRQSLNQMREVGERNFRAGYLSAADYLWGVQALDTWSQHLSLENCTTASGQNLKFFECLSDGTNHIALCARRFHPSF